MPENDAKSRKSWEKRNVVFLTYGDHQELPDVFQELQHLTLPRTRVFPLRPRRPPSPPPPPRDHRVGMEPSRSGEHQFLMAASERPLRIGRLNLRCQLFPKQLWDADRRRHLYRDDPEAERRLVLDWIDVPLPEDTLASLVQEIPDSCIRGPGYWFFQEMR